MPDEANRPSATDYKASNYVFRQAIAILLGFPLIISGLFLATYQFFNWQFITQIVAKNTPGSSLALFGLLIFGVGLTVILTQVFMEVYSTSIKGVTFGGVLAALLIFMWIANSQIFDPAHKAELENLAKQRDDLATAKDTFEQKNNEQANTIAELFLAKNAPRDLSLDIECPQNAKQNSSLSGGRESILSVSGRAASSRMSQVRQTLIQMEKDGYPDPAFKGRLIDTSERLKRFPYLEEQGFIDKTDVLLRASRSAGVLRFYIPSLLTGEGLKLTLWNASDMEISQEIDGQANSFLFIEITDGSMGSTVRPTINATLRLEEVNSACGL